MFCKCLLQTRGLPLGAAETARSEAETGGELARESQVHSHCFQQILDLETWKREPGPFQQI